MFDTNTTYPTDGVIIARPAYGEMGTTHRFGGRTYAFATAQATEDAAVTLGRVYRTEHSGDGAFRIAERNGYDYRYFRGAALNTPTPDGMPVMLFGPDADLPWLVGKVISREGTDRVTVTPLWGPPGEALPPVASGDAWARVVDTPPAVMLWHPDDDLAAAEAKQQARNTWLRWHVAWLALLGETVVRDWGTILGEISEAVNYTPPIVTWRASTRVGYEVVLRRMLGEEEQVLLRSALSLPDGADLPGTPISAAHLEENIEFSVQARIPDPDQMPDLDVAARVALSNRRPGATYVSHGGVDLTPSYH